MKEICGASGKELSGAVKANYIEVLSILKEQRGILKILEFGSGTGRFAKLMSNQGHKVTASDFIPEQCEVNCKKIDLRRDVNTKEKYDCIIVLEVIEHLPNPTLLFENAYKCLKNNGLLIVSTPNVQSWYSRLIFLLTGKLHTFNWNYRKADFNHLHPIFQKQVTLMAEGLFKIKEIRYNRSIIPRLKWLMPFKNRILSQNCIYVLRKINSSQ